MVDQERPSTEHRTRGTAFLEFLDRVGYQIIEKSSGDSFLNQLITVFFTEGRILIPKRLQRFLPSRKNHSED